MKSLEDCICSVTVCRIGGLDWGEESGVFRYVHTLHSISFKCIAGCFGWFGHVSRAEGLSSAVWSAGFRNTVRWLQLSFLLFTWKGWQRVIFLLLTFIFLRKQMYGNMASHGSHEMVGPHLLELSSFWPFSITLALSRRSKQTRLPSVRQWKSALRSNT